MPAFNFFLCISLLFNHYWITYLYLIKYIEVYATYFLCFESFYDKIYGSVVLGVQNSTIFVYLPFSWFSS